MYMCCALKCLAWWWRQGWGVRAGVHDYFGGGRAPPNPRLVSWWFLLWWRRWWRQGWGVRAGVHDAFGGTVLLLHAYVLCSQMFSLFCLCNLLFHCLFLGSSTKWCGGVQLLQPATGRGARYCCRIYLCCALKCLACSACATCCFIAFFLNLLPNGAVEYSYSNPRPVGGHSTVAACICVVLSNV